LASAHNQAGQNLGAAQRLFEGACGACHHNGASSGGGPQVFGLNLPLALHSSLHSARPDNLIQAVLEGVREPATPNIGFMPAFKHSLSDAQIAELAAYMRQRFAPGRPQWQNLATEVARIRAAVVTR
jgi:nicotinate dehydrogenase subunit B